MKFVKIFGSKKTAPALVTVAAATRMIEGVTFLGQSEGRDEEGKFVRVDYDGVLSENKLRDALNTACRTTGTTNWTYQWGD